MFYKILLFDWISRRNALRKLFLDNVWKAWHDWWKGMG